MHRAVKIADKRYTLPEGLSYAFLDSTRTAMILTEDPQSKLFNGRRVVDAEDLNGRYISREDKQHRVEDLIFRHGGFLSERPLRPTKEFLKNIGIGYLPEDVDITFRLGGPYGHAPVQRFFITLVDRDGEPVHERSLYAWETAERPKKAIWAELQKILIHDHGALPLDSAKIYQFPPRPSLAV